MSAASDLALLSSLEAQVEDLTARVVEVADRYRPTSDSSVTVDLDAAERALTTARRGLARARQSLEAAAARGPA